MGCPAAHGEMLGMLFHHQPDRQQGVSTSPIRNSSLVHISSAQGIGLIQREGDQLPEAISCHVRVSSFLQGISLLKITFSLLTADIIPYCASSVVIKHRKQTNICMLCLA